MYLKRTLASTDDIPEKKRFRADILDLTISSDISGQRAARLIHHAKLANTENISDLAKVPVGKNSARDLLRRCFRNSKWPDVYTLEVPAWNPGKNVPQNMKLHMLLPHELMLAVLKVNSMDGLLRRQQLALAHRPDLSRHLGQASAQLGIDATKTLIAGLWVDSVPFNSDRTHSLEVFTFSLIGEGPMRFPICCFPKAFLKKHSTHDAILAVLAWSFRATLCGVCPSMRHDATAWRTTDKHRRRLQGKSAPIMILGELRGDWSMYKDLLEFPSWAAAGPICWRCDCTRAQLKDFTLASLTRRRELTSMDFLMRQHAADKFISQIFSIPLFGSENCKFDFLHCVDLGITCDFIGSMFYYLQEYVLPGRSRHDKCALIFQEISAYYKANDSENRLPKLVPTMLRAEERGKMKAPKLRAKAGEARTLVPCVMQIADKFLDSSVPAQNTMIHASRRLNSMYECLSEQRWLPDLFQQVAALPCLQFLGKC
ncbi:unnamed protein product [Symbiodinium natans]|uniref:Uncharacterized protein n=1 Tax=Symbiodinium natans TaxID=878477 RepID=A0A812NKB4_9DINO|nr:unnamed protein product [Symbiodinium natans]